MKTELLHSYSSSSLSNLSRSSSAVSFSMTGAYDVNGIQAKGDAVGGLGVPQPEQSSSPVKNVCGQFLRKKMLYKKLPILQWLPKYDTKKLVADFIAGITVGLTILPQGLAYATIASLPPQYGLYSGFVGCFVYIFFGGTKPVTIGPTAVMAIMTLSYIVGKPVEYAILLCFLTGVVTLLMGLLQLGFIVNFISIPVIRGFTSAAAITICFTQVKALLGLSFPAEGVVSVIEGVILNIQECRLNDVVLSIICVAALLFLQNLQKLAAMAIKKVPPIVDKICWLISTSRSVIVILACTVYVSSLSGESPVQIVGTLEGGLPSLQPPPFSFNLNTTGEIQHVSFLKLLKQDSSALIVLPLLALMEHIMGAKAFAGQGRVDASQELICIGLTNIVGSFFSSMPVTGAFSRTVVNHASGVASPLGGLFTGALVLLALRFLTPFLSNVPKASLAAVIVTAVIFTIDFSVVLPMWKCKKTDLIPWSVTFLVSIFVGLEFGILCGFIISVIFLMYYAARPGVKVKRGVTIMGREFILVDLDRSLVFPSVEYTRYVIVKAGSNWAKGSTPLVIDCHHIQFADFSAARGVCDLFKLFNEKKHELILWKVKPSVIRILTSVMEVHNVPFKYCDEEEELDKILENAAKNQEQSEKKGQTNISFSMDGGEDSSEDETDMDTL